MLEPVVSLLLHLVGSRFTGFALGCIVGFDHCLVLPGLLLLDLDKLFLQLFLDIAKRLLFLFFLDLCEHVQGSLLLSEPLSVHKVDKVL